MTLRRTNRAGRTRLLRWEILSLLLVSFALPPFCLWAQAGRAELTAIQPHPSDTNSKAELQQLLAEADAAWQAGDAGRAAVLYQRVSAHAPEAPEAREARYREGHALAAVPGKAREAAQALETFVRRDAAFVSPRLVTVARQEAQRLRGLEGHLPAYDAVLRLQAELLRLPEAARLEWLNAQLKAGAGERPPEVTVALHELAAEEAWFRGEWSATVWHLERVLELPGVDSQQRRELLKQAKQELFQEHLAVLTAALVGVGVVGAGFLTRQARRRPLSPVKRIVWRRVALLILNWWGLLGLLYLFYVLGKKAGDVSPVTAGRLLALMLSTTGAQLLAIWWGALLADWRGPVGENAGASKSLVFLRFGVGLVFHLCAVYLFCYAFDYVSVLGL